MIKNKKYFKIFFFLFFCFELLFYSDFIFAQEPRKYSGVESEIKQFLCTPTDAKINPEGAKGDLYTCINKLYRFAIVISSIVAVFFIVIAGYIYMAAEGNEESVTKAKDILVTSVASIVILFIGYILLKFLNPDVIKFQPIQPQNLTGANPWNSVPVEISRNPDGTFKIRGGAGHTAKELEDVGCVFQTDNQKQEVPHMTEMLFSKIKDLCYNSKQSLKTSHPNISPKISSVIGIGKHTQNSYHYKGCAVDFADNNPNFRRVEPGLTIVKEAEKLGFRINPGTDANKYDHVHVDLSTACGNGE